MTIFSINQQKQILFFLQLCFDLLLGQVLCMLLKHCGMLIAFMEASGSNGKEILKRRIGILPVVEVFNAGKYMYATSYGSGLLFRENKTPQEFFETAEEFFLSAFESGECECRKIRD